jgi:crotonobetainyl-CoA:carnitine CoA-transferase CaiB-like acyl-CoA transferase
MRHARFTDGQHAREAQMAADRPTHVLDGYKVLDFSQVLAGPTVTRLMAEMGADVIKLRAGAGSAPVISNRDPGSRPDSHDLWNQFLLRWKCCNFKKR